jgi:virginiamycin B lyase
LGSRLRQIVTGSGDSAWFINNIQRGNINFGEYVVRAQVDRVDSSGNLTPFRVGGAGILGLAHEPGGVSFSRGGHVGRLSPDGQVAEFRVRTGEGDALSLAFGAGGYLWLTRETPGGHDAIQRISSDHSVRTFALPHAHSGPGDITRGTDGAMWFTEYFGERLGRITSSGKITEYPLPVRAGGEETPVQPVGGIAAGTEGDIWFGTIEGIGLLEPSSGKVTLFYRHRAAEAMAAAPGGGVWFADGPNRIGRLTRSGKITDIHLPSGTGTVRSLAVGSDGSVWYTASPSGKSGVVGRLVFGG